jgi:pyridinium-3,5-bisthiocarboxylic acid mononucleotide nickel chelatase
VKTLWVDASNGAAGDMLLAALLDAGADLDAVRTGLRGIDVEPVGLTLNAVRRHGLRAAQVVVDAPGSEATRNLPDVVSILSRAGLPRQVQDFAVAVFQRLARAEAGVHGVAPDEIGFHEVGALDAIADVAGCALALHSLGLLQPCTRVVSPVAAGSGSVRTAHGTVPVPVPAVLRMLADATAPLSAHPAAMELCTPTGAALLTTMATAWGAAPACTVLAVGTGAGAADPDGHPNVLRVLVGEAAGPADWASAGMYRIDATIDDLDPRLWPDVLDEVHAAGAADAWCAPVLMRKGRPGHVLSALAGADVLDAVCQAMFRQTTTLGVRVSPVQRRSLHRDQIAVSVAGARVSVKRGLLGETVVTAQPEYEDVRAAARLTGRPVAEVLAEARRQSGAADRQVLPSRQNGP